jgi:hypothetical protein
MENRRRELSADSRAFLFSPPIVGEIDSLCSFTA